jgi:peptide deformylase
MVETLIDSNGAGLAAPQVGILRRIAVVDMGDEIVELINPEIIAVEGQQQELEGCLSVPDVWGITDRPQKVTVKALNRFGEEFTVTGEDLDARCFCHELDHLDGHLFTDKAIRILTPDEVAELKGE